MTTPVIQVVEEKTFVTVEGEDQVISIVEPTEIQVITSFEGPPGQTGPPGPPGSEPFIYVHDQLIPNTVWTINHDLDGYPNVTAMDSSGNEIEGVIAYPSAQIVVLTFTSPVGGQAFLS